IVAGVLTLIMFLMLAHMIKRDHFDAPPPPHHLHVRNHAGRHDNSYSEQSFALGGDGQLWKPDGLTNVVLKPCWSKPVLEEEEEQEESRGFVTFSLTNGPEYHISQIANAVVVARYLRATLIIPDIRGTQPGTLEISTTLKSL
ncbi:hypothetical protein Tco_1330670, partial [Tanacetum coccineum]